MTEIVGTDGEFTTDEVAFQIRNIIVQEFSRAIAGAGIPVLDMAANTGEVGKLVANAISATISAYGLTLPELYIENVSLPPAVEKALDDRTSRGITGNLDDHMNTRLPRPWRSRALAPVRPWAWAWAQARHADGQHDEHGPLGSTAWCAPQAAPAAAAPPPPPPPVEHVWHIAENGQTKGPFSKADMGRMATAGEVTRETLVWTPGQDGWLLRMDVAELAQLFTIMPPPPPPPAPV